MANADLTTPAGRLEFVKKTAITLGLTADNVLIINLDDGKEKIAANLNAYQKKLSQKAGKDVPLDLYLRSVDGHLKGFDEGKQIAKYMFYKAGKFHEYRIFVEALDTVTAGEDSTIILLGNNFNVFAANEAKKINQASMSQQKHQSPIKSPAISLSNEEVIQFILRHEVAHAATLQSDQLFENKLIGQGNAQKFSQSPYIDLLIPSNQDKLKSQGGKQMNPCANYYGKSEADNYWRESAADGVATLLSIQDGMSPEKLRLIAKFRHTEANQNYNERNSHNSLPLMNHLIAKYSPKDLEGKSGQEMLAILGKELREVWLKPDFYEKLKKPATGTIDRCEVSPVNALPSKSLPNKVSLNEVSGSETIPTPLNVNHQELWQRSIAHGNAAQENQSVTRAV